ncbi:hypothetical protein Vadar_016420 [Vaccinium darrowii]|uniref:Uncharacterized protein n=1 Tax=Vaccinium darrowii TaxID=229202 RepID=A0ACB7YX15_9ERIC|nr:hypothetical protein Vadar_016420 [Vaccinium darrowii]
MCCVELESKLYFLGGIPHRDQKGPLSRDVYVLDVATAAACARSSSCSNQKGPSEELLKKGTPMNTGKPFPYMFVAYGRIFVIDGRSFYRDYMDEKLSWFEVFDPDTNQWLTMPDPPIYVRLIGHAVVDKKVFLVGMDDSVFYFNLDTGLWVTSSKYSRRPHSPFYGRAEFVQDTLYACHRRTIVAFDGLCSSEAHHDDKPERLFYRKAFLGPEMKEALYDGKYYAPHSSPYLVPYGNRTFCYVLASSLPDPNNPIYLKDSERFHIRLTVFQALKGADAVPRPIVLISRNASLSLCNLVQGRHNEIKCKH